MTVKRQKFIGLDDILAIQYECKSCGTKVSVPRATWGILNHSCPQCREDPNAVASSEWIHPNGSEARCLIALQSAIDGLVGAQRLGCRIVLEITDEPVSPSSPE